MESLRGMGFLISNPFTRRSGVPLQLLSLGKVFGLLRVPRGCYSFCGQ